MEKKPAVEPWKKLRKETARIWANDCAQNLCGWVKSVTSASAHLCELADGELDIQEVTRAGLLLIPGIGAPSPTAPEDVAEGQRAIIAPPSYKTLVLEVLAAWLDATSTTTLAQVALVTGEVELEAETNQIKGLSIEVREQSLQAMNRQEGLHEISERAITMLNIIIPIKAALLSGEFTKRNRESESETSKDN